MAHDQAGDLAVSQGARAYGRNVITHGCRSCFRIASTDGVEDRGMLGHGLLDINRPVVHGLAESMYVRGETLGHLQQVSVVAVAQEDEVKTPVDGVVLA